MPGRTQLLPGRVWNRIQVCSTSRSMYYSVLLVLPLIQTPQRDLGSLLVWVRIDRFIEEQKIYYGLGRKCQGGGLFSSRGPG